MCDVIIISRVSNEMMLGAVTKKTNDLFKKSAMVLHLSQEVHTE